MQQTPFEQALEAHLAHLGMPLGERLYGYEMDAAAEMERARTPRIPLGDSVEGKILARMEEPERSYDRAFEGEQPLFLRRSAIYKGLGFSYGVWPAGATVSDLREIDWKVRERDWGENGYEGVNIFHDPNFEEEAARSAQARKEAIADFYSVDLGQFEMRLLIYSGGRIRIETDGAFRVSELLTDDAFEEVRENPEMQEALAALGEPDAIKERAASQRNAPMDYQKEGHGVFFGGVLNEMMGLDSLVLDSMGIPKLLDYFTRLREAIDREETDDPDAF